MPDSMDPRYVPQARDQKLGYLVEECGEVTEKVGGLLAALGKTQRWGLTSSNPELPEEQREPNLHWILRAAGALRKELVDLERALRFVELDLVVHAAHVFEEPYAGVRCEPSGTVFVLDFDASESLAFASKENRAFRQLVLLRRPIGHHVFAVFVDELVTCPRCVGVGVGTALGKEHDGG